MSSDQLGGGSEVPIPALKEKGLAPGDASALKREALFFFVKTLDSNLCEKLAYDDIWYHSILLNSQEVRDIGRRKLKELIEDLIEAHFIRQRSSGITLGLLLTPDVEVRIALYRGGSSGLAIIEKGKTVKLGCGELLDRYRDLEGNAEIYELPNYRLKR